MKRTVNLKKALKIALIVILAVVVLFIGLSFIKVPFAKHWKTNGITNSPITKIRLSGYPREFDGYVEFNDEDLIQKWTDYFNSIDIQHNIGLDFSTVGSLISPRDGVCFDSVTVYTEGSTLNLTFYDSGVMTLNNGLRKFAITGGEYPFEEIYETAKERHGLSKN